MDFFDVLVQGFGEMGGGLLDLRDLAGGGLVLVREVIYQIRMQGHMVSQQLNCLL